MTEGQREPGGSRDLPGGGHQVLTAASEVGQRLGQGTRGPTAEARRVPRNARGGSARLTALPKRTTELGCTGWRLRLWPMCLARAQQVTGFVGLLCG